MTYEQAVAKQEQLCENGKFTSLRQSEDDVSNFYLIPHDESVCREELKSRNRAPVARKPQLQLIKGGVK
jgi:hypothetical protein